MYIDTDIAAYYSKLIEIELHKPLHNPPFKRKKLCLRQSFWLNNLAACLIFILTKECGHEQTYTFSRVKTHGHAKLAVNSIAKYLIYSSTAEPG